MCVLQTKCNLGAMLHFDDIGQKCQCPKTAVFGKNGQLRDSAYHTRPEAEPDIESALQGYYTFLLLYHASKP